LPSLNVSLCSWTVDADLGASFSSFCTKNFKCQSTWKLCPSTRWRTFIKVDFQVFRWILENAAKVPADSYGHQGWRGFDQVFDHGLAPQECLLAKGFNRVG
jgi:hypothetical protein